MNNTQDGLHAIAELLAFDHSTGSAGAALLLLECGDCECPSCGEGEPITRHLIDALGDRLRFVVRHFSSAKHPYAEIAAEKVEAAGVQGMFWPMHHLLFTHRQRLEPDALTHYAEMAGLDMRRFATAMAYRTYRPRVREHRRSGEQIGLHGSPGFFLRGKVVDVSFGLEHLEHAIRAALGKA